MRPELGNHGRRKKNEKKLTEAILQFAEQKGFFNSKMIREYAVENYSYKKVGEMLDHVYERALKK